MGVTNLKLCGADGEVAVDADAPYGRVGPLTIVATTSFRPVRIQAAAARTIVAKATSTA